MNRAADHVISKESADAIGLVAGHGVEGDAHFGKTVQHRYTKRHDPSRPNLRQVHLVGEELFDVVARAGLTLGPGEIGENITTRGVDLENLPLGTRLHLGPSAIVEVTGLRDPCGLIDRVRPGLRAAVTVERDGVAVVRHGVMGIVVNDGLVSRDDRIAIEFPAGERRKLQPV